MDSTVVQEGFLCPICMKDLGDIIQLEQHFSDFHNQTDKEDLFFPIKGMASKNFRIEKHLMRLFLHAYL